MYLIKIKGKARIPDYVQLRDEHFTLIAYFRLDRPERALQKCGLGHKQALIMAELQKIPFGQMHKITLDD